VRIAKEYFARLDAGSAELPDLFTEDAQLYFPKFGMELGRSAFLEELAGPGGE